VTGEKIYFLRVKIIDKQGNNIDKAKPTLTTDGKTVNFQSNPTMGHHLQLTEPSRLLVDLGDYVLTVSASGYSNLEQKFVLRSHSGGNITFTPKEGSPLYAAVSLSRERGKASDTWSAINFVLTVTLYEPSEVVMVAGFDYPTTKHPKGGGTNFELFCDSRVSELEVKKIIDKGTVVTYFNFKDGNKKTLRKIKKGTVERWVKTKEEKQGDGAPLMSEYVTINDHIYCKTRRNTISITNVYDYIKNVGKTRPGTIKELSIFSHAWQGGVILLNTLEIPQSRINGYAVIAKDTRGATLSSPKIFTITVADVIGSEEAKPVSTGDPLPREADAVVMKGGLSSKQINGTIEVYSTVNPAANVNYVDERDPDDKDSRLKDFNSKNMPDVDHFKKAFHSNSTIRIWGCNAGTAFQQIIKQILKATSDSDILTITYTNNNDERQTVGPVTRKVINDRMKVILATQTYMGCIAKASGVKTHGALLGAGASFGRRGKKQFMYIDKKKLKSILDYHERQLNVKVDDYGYGIYEP